MKKYVPAVVVISLLLAAVALVLLNMLDPNTSHEWDEPTYIAAGYYFLKTGDPGMIVSHPMLAKELAALPLLAVQPNLPANASSYVDYSYVKFGYDFMYQSDNNVGQILFLSRLPFVLLFVWLGLIVYRWSTRLYGQKAGMFSVLLYSFSPLMLANAGVVLTELVVTAFIFFTIYFFWRFLHKPNWRHLTLTGISLGLALSSKATANYLFPIMILLFIITLWKGQLPRMPWSFPYKRLPDKLHQVVSVASFMLVISVIAVAVVWVSFGFQFGALADEAGSARYLNIAIDEISSAFPDRPGLVSLAEKVAGIPVPFPSYIASYGLTLHASIKPRIPAYLNGDTYVGGKWQYYFVAFALKTPIPFLIMLALAFLLPFLMHRKFTLSDYFLLIPPVLIFMAFLPAQFNVGLKHLLPMYPFLFVFSGKLVNLRFKRNLQLAFGLLLALLSIWYVVGTVSVHPYYVSYFNEFVGPENGYKYLASADLSTGSNLPALKAYMEQHGIPSVQLSYLGSADPSYYGINYTYLPSPYFQGWDPHYSPQLPGNYTEECYPRTGLIAISATNLHGIWLVNTSCYAWLAQLAPVDSIGYEILIYNVTEDDIN